MKIHIVRPGDTLWVLAQKYNTPIERLREANPELTEGSELEPGMKIRVPTGKFLLTTSKDKELQPKVEVAPPAEEGSKAEDSLNQPAEMGMGSLPKPPHVPEMPLYYQGDLSSSSDSPESSFYDDGYLQDVPVPPVSPYPYYTYNLWHGSPLYDSTPFISAFPYSYGPGYGYHIPYSPAESNYVPAPYQAGYYGWQGQTTPAYSGLSSANWPIKESSSSEG
ncbi:MAG: LysM domain-containing protein [Thermoactinomyces sp.]